MAFFLVDLIMIHIVDLKFQGYSGAIGSFVVSTVDGLVLVETGPHSTLEGLKAGLDQFGYTLSDIKHVLLTHIHLDHAGAAWYLASLGADIYVHEYGYSHLKNPERLMASASRIYGAQMHQLWGDMKPIPEKRLKKVSDEQPIEIGGEEFTPWYTPGHAKHHIAWQLGSTLFTGDVAGVKIENGPVMPPCPPPDIDIALWIQSLDKIRELSLEELYLTHFGVITDIQRHLDQLQVTLVKWAQWIKPYWEAQARPSEIVGPFQQLVADQLTDSGLSKLEIELYEAANPSWMSVYGLLRYWEKHGSNPDDTLGESPNS